MRHNKRGRKLNRNSSHRISMFRNMIISLISYECIKTTISKAKELRRFIERIISISLQDNFFSKRLLFDRIRNKLVIKKLFNVLVPRYKNFHGGYTRILKCGYRNGDKALMVYISLIKGEK